MLNLSLNSVLIADPVHESCAALLQQHGIRTLTKTKMTKEELIQVIKDYDGVVVRSETKIDEEVLKAGKRLRVVGRAGTGVDNIDCLAATEHGIIVMNTPGGNSTSACELTCALIMNLARNVASACSSLKSGLWQRKDYMGTELKGKTLAVLGLGRIGREVATRMGAFGMELIGYDPIPLQRPIPGMEVLSLEEIWPRADYITVHVPLLPQTKGLIGRNELLFKCKEGVRVINCSRGGVVDEKALLDAVRTRGVKAALDVFTEEPPKSQELCELIKHPNVIVTPHLGASTVEAQERVAVEIAEQFIGLSRPDSGYQVDGAVNFPGLRDLLRESGWARIGRALGSLGRGLSTSAGAWEGELGGPSHLSAPVLLGLLGGGGGQEGGNGLNLVSAPSLAESKGIRLSVNPVEGGDADGNRDVTLKINGTGSDGKHTVKGTVREGEGYLLSIDEAIFSPGARITQNTIFVRSNNPQTDCPKLMGELMMQGAVVTNMSMAQGKSCSWFAIETNQSSSQININTLQGIVA